MYEDISLRFYRSWPEVFELYTHYMYEKIFGESFVPRSRTSSTGCASASSSASRTSGTA